jgi:HSP20 family molecular chaperone IbpA
MSDPGTEMSPKAKVSYDQERFQVEFCVQDYRPEELSIKTEGDVLIVLAKHETKAEGGQSFVSKQFEQRFSLPSGVKPEKISSSLSKDGILTVTAPRESMGAVSALKKKPIDSSGQVFSQSAETKEKDGLPHPRVSYDDDKFQISLDAKDYKPDELDVKVEGNTIIITAKQEIQEQGGTRTRVFEQKFSLPSGVKADRVTSSLNREGTLLITAPRGNPAAAQSYTETLENKVDRVLAPSAWDSQEKRRDSNFDDRKTFDDRKIDSAFDDFRRDSAAFNSALSNPKHSSIFDSQRSNSMFDDKSIFDKERSGSIFDRDDRSVFAANSEQSGVSRVQYDDDTYKILVNVESYKPEELVIKTVDNTVHVEAKHEEKTSDGRNFSTKSFSQSFTLPRGVNPEAVSSALSKDGILTISAPLPPPAKPLAGERLVPIKHQ